jgi:hypothetical protein
MGNKPIMKKLSQTILNNYQHDQTPHLYNNSDHLSRLRFDGGEEGASGERYNRRPNNHDGNNSPRQFNDKKGHSFEDGKSTLLSGHHNIRYFTFRNKMKNKELFDKTIAILVKAYQNDTLEHGDCQACAVGNLVAANKGIRLYRDSDGTLCSSHSYFDNAQWARAILEGKEDKGGFEEIKTTGYSIEELILIENAFELYPRSPVFDYDQDGYKGLMSVVDCLMQIHEADQLECDEAKQLFIRINN